jgi:hypothetical protein
MTEALFVLSTGRCGTQWLAEALRGIAGDRARVTHEPLDNDYAPREILGAHRPEALNPDLAEPVLKHLASIEETLRERNYIECGHPLWSTLPYLLERFAGRVRVIHLVRHPVPVAISWVTQAAYIPPFAPHLPEKVLLSPFDEGVRFPSFRERWASMTPYEKALYYWAEINALGLDLEKSTTAPWMRVRFEDLFGGETMKSIAAFAGLEGPVPYPPKAVDEYRFLLTSWADPGLVARHAEVVSIAEQLGYDPLGFDENRLRLRYVGA